VRIERADELVSALERAARDGGVQVIEVTIESERDRARRADIHAAVGAVLAGR